MSTWNQPPASPDPYNPSGTGSQPPGDPYAQPSANPYGQPGADPYAQPSADPYAHPSADPYAQPSADPYAQPYGGAPYAQPSAGPYGQSGAYGDPYAPAGQAYGAAYNPYVGYGVMVPHPGAPYGVDPKSGLPYSSKTKIVAGLLQIFLGSLGVGRFYTGHYGIAIAQILVTLVTFGIGALWPLIDGIMMLAGDPKDSDGYPLRP